MLDEDTLRARLAAIADDFPEAAITLLVRDDPLHGTFMMTSDTAENAARAILEANGQGTAIPLSAAEIEEARAALDHLKEMAAMFNSAARVHQAAIGVERCLLRLPTRTP